MKTRVLIPLVNRAKGNGNFELPSDGWYHVVPKGEFPHAESGLVQVIDDKAIKAMADSFDPAQEPLIDFDHESHDSDKRTTAAGWIQNVEARDDGLWMQTRWSDEGEAALKGGRYRFISPVWYANDCEPLDGNRIRPLRLADAGITNNPNLMGGIPLSNRAATSSDDDAQTQNADTEKPMKKLNAALGLSADASEESALEALQKLQNRATTAEAAIAPLQTKHTELQNRHNSLLATTVEADLDAAGLEGDDREAWKGQLLANRDTTLKLLASVVKNRGTAAAKTLTNRAEAKTPGQKTGAAAGAGDEGKSRTQLAAEAIAAEKAIIGNRGGANELAYQNAKRKHPDLFKPEEASA